MGTVADKLGKLAQTKADIRAAIMEKGQTVEETEPFSAYAGKIRAISDGGASKEEIEAYLKGACIDFAATQGENTLHLRQQEGGFDCTVHWGDGEETVVPADGGNVVHIYAQAGTYRIYITGRSFAGFYVNNQEGKEKYVALYSMGRWETDTMISAENAFYGCTGLTSLPGDLFRYNVGITSFVATFFMCTGLTSLPGDLFRYNTAAALFTHTFSGCSELTELPADLFRYNTEAGAFLGTFAGCTGLTSLPGGLFQQNTKAISFISTFNGDSALREIPRGLFSENKQAQAFERCFEKCVRLTAVPEDMFRYNEKATNFHRCFYGCTELTTLPADLFRYNIAAVDFSYCFHSCIKLCVRDDIFGLDMETRFLGQSPGFSNCFVRSSYEGEPGKAPALWKFVMGTMTSGNRRRCFGGAGNSETSLSNYGEIPGIWRS